MFTHDTTIRLERIEQRIEHIAKFLIQFKGTVMSGLTDLQGNAAALKQLELDILAALQNLENAAGDPDATVEDLSQQIGQSIADIRAGLNAIPTGSTGATGATGAAAPSA